MVINSAQKGFTIVELLIVIIVIGILASIIIVAYNGVTKSARDSSVKSDLSNIANKLEVYKAINGLYPATTAQMDAADFKVAQDNYKQNRNNLYYCRTADFSQYAIGVEATTGSQFYLVNGSAKIASGINSANTCAEIPSGVGVASGYAWDPATSTGTWAVWTE